MKEVNREIIKIGENLIGELFDGDSKNWSHVIKFIKDTDNDLVTYDLIVRRNVDNKFFKLKVNYCEHVVMENVNSFPIDGIQVFPKQLVSIIYE